MIAGHSRVIVFDVNETLLDLAGLDQAFGQIFGDLAVRREWFAQLLQSAFVSIVTDAYADFGAVGRAALEMVAGRRGRMLTDADRERVALGMTHLPPQPEARLALETLRAAGLRLATLTNSTERVARAQLEHAGLDAYFERILSADAVRRLKPAPEPYRMAARVLGVPVEQVRLVAAHSWDVAGALRASCAAAFVARPGMVLDPLAPEPDIVGRDLVEVADRILRVDLGQD